MHIAMLAPISWPLPPTGYGPWELVASNLTEELVGLGHDVTLFAAGGTHSTAHVVCTSPHALETWPEPERSRPRAFDPATGLLEGPPDARVLEGLHIATCMERAAAGEFDVVHSHLHVHALVFGRLIPCPLVSTLHGSAWGRASHPILLAYRDLPFVSLSDAERQFLPQLNYVATVHNGIRLAEFPYAADKEDYLLFSGRLAPEKGPDTAIEVARRCGRRLLLAGMIEPQYEEFFDAEIRPHLEGGQVEFLGLLSQPQLVPYLQKAAAVLLVGRWAEPFGLSAVEAQACGTPLIATRRGALPEIIVEGETGFVVDSVEQAVAAAARLGSLAPAACRRNAEDRFSTTVMAKGYEAVYARLIA
ncbi:MAG: glycosyltransferase family 4 protein [Planctomycetota bacterium]|jgi:glycosyltransferase involved in cell wall biosynthesis